ncbi:MAG: toll/interleukin-1 receptor domain-containing protein [Bacteroidota bacterium]
MDEKNHINIFIAYSEEDSKYLRKLDLMFSVLRDTRLKLWWKDLVEFGTDKEEAIQKQLDSADIILLLLSAEFFGSEHIHKLELKQALEKHKDGSARVIPIILRSCPWDLNESFKKLKPLPENGKPAVQWESLDAAFTNVVINVQNTVMNIRTKLNIQPEVKEEVEAIPEIQEKSKEVWDKSEPQQEQISYQASHEKNNSIYAMPGEWQPVLQSNEDLQDSSAPKDQNDLDENKDVDNQNNFPKTTPEQNQAELKNRLQQLANENGFEFTEYQRNQFHIRVTFDMPDKTQRYQSVYTWIADIGKDNKPCIYMNTRVGIYSPQVNLYEFAKEAAYGIYSAITIVDDKDTNGNPCETIILQAAPNLESTNYDLFKQIVLEVAATGDFLEEKYFGKDFH